MKFRYLLCLFLLGFKPVCGISSSWVPMDDLGLRADIQLLADAGVLSAPITTYPLMWESLALDIEQADINSLTVSQRMALTNLRTTLNDSLKLHQTDLTAYASSQSRRFTSFGHNDFDKHRLSLSHTYTSNNWVGHLQVNHRPDIDETDAINDGQDNTLDGSYLGVKLGNWVLTAGAIERWWGPGIDTSLILSNNARPLPAIAITRNSSTAFESAWLSWIGPWTFTTQMSRLESDRVISEPLLWLARGTFRPLRGLEIGISRAYQWGGEGQSESLSAFWDGVIGETECTRNAETCSDERRTNAGNQLAGYDFRWSDTLVGIPYALYAQTIGEDSNAKANIVDKAYLFGLEFRFLIGEQRFWTSLEYSETLVSCLGGREELKNCFYEHSDYESGYRYYRRSIGSTYESDAKTLVLTLLAQLSNGNSWQLKLRRANLNDDNNDKFPNDPNLGNTVSKVAEEFHQADIQYRFSLQQSQVTLGLLFNDSTIESVSDSDQEAYLKYQYQF